MDIVNIATGLGLLCIGIGVIDGIRSVVVPEIKFLMEISKLEKRRASRPILLPDWNLPKT
jgi:hypothetical protein